MLHDDVIAELAQLEEALWRPETRGSREFMESVLAEDFIEFGASGHVYDRRMVIDADVSGLDAVLPLQDFAVRELGGSGALVTYRSIERREAGDRIALRSSLWGHDGYRWRLLFHQGTLAGGA